MAATRRATEPTRLTLGIVLCVLGVLYFKFVSSSQLGIALLFFGAALMFVAYLGRGCNACGKVMQYREFGYAPARLDEVTEVVRSNDVDRVIGLLASPRIGDLVRPRTALMVSCCPRCQQIAELTVGEMGTTGFRTCTEQVYQGPDVARLFQAVRTTKKQG